MESITFRSKNFSITVKRTGIERSVVIETHGNDIPYEEALDLEKEFTALLTSALNVKL